MGAVAVGVAIGAVVGGAAAAIQSGGDFNAIWKGALVGAVGGAVGGWAAPALAPALGTVGAGMAAGALGGVTSGVLGAAINGGTGDDYWKGALFGGVGGAAVGGLTAGLGEAFGGQTAVNGEIAAPVSADVSGALPTDASGIPLTAQGGYAFDDAAQAASGVGNVGGGSEVINTSVTGAPAQSTPAYTAPQLDTSTPSTGTFDFQGTANAANQSTNTSLQNLGLQSVGEGTSTAFQPNMSTSANPTISGGDYGMTMSTGDVVSSTGDKLGVAPGFETPGTPTVRGTADVFGGQDSGWSMDKLFNWDTAKTIGKGAMLGQTLKGAGALLGQNEARQNQRQLMDLYNQQNAYMQQQQGQNAQAFQQNIAANTANQQAFRDQLNAAQGYNTQLQGTYEDPNAYLNSPEAQATRSLAMQKLLAQNAAAGRRSSGLAMQNQLMANQLQNLGTYRTGLRQAIQYPNQLAGMQYQGADAATNAKILAAAQAQSPTGNLMAGLGSMFTPAANYYLLAS